MSDAIERIRMLPIWPGPVEPKPLAGGLSNRGYSVEAAGRRYVVRLGCDLPHHHVSRTHELMASRAAHGLGLSPEIVHAEPGLMVLAFVEGRTFAAADVRAHLPRVAALVRRYHVEMARAVSGPAAFFSPFHAIRDYVRLLQRPAGPRAAGLERLLESADALERAQVPAAPVFGHNDLLPANLIDDGDRLWLIDHEYAAFATPMFDLAGLASNAGFSAAENRRLLEAYLGEAPGAALLRSHAAMQCVSLLRESLWGMVSDLHPGVPGFDFAGYARDNLERFEAALGEYRRNYPEA